MDFRAFAERFVIDNGFDPAPIVLVDAWESAPDVVEEAVPEVPDEPVFATAEQLADPTLEASEVTVSEAGVEVTITNHTDTDIEVDVTVDDGVVTEAHAHVQTDIAEPVRQAGNSVVVLEATESEETADAVVEEHRYDPNQKRDPDGKWGDGIAGPQSPTTGGPSNEAARVGANATTKLSDAYENFYSQSRKNQQRLDRAEAQVRDMVSAAHDRKQGKVGSIDGFNADEVRSARSAQLKSLRAVDGDDFAAVRQTTKDAQAEKDKLARLAAEGVEARNLTRQISSREELAHEMQADMHRLAKSHGSVREGIRDAQSQGKEIGEVLYEDITPGSDEYTSTSYDRAAELATAIKNAKPGKDRDYMISVMEQMVSRGDPAYDRSADTVRDGLAAANGSKTSMDDLFKAFDSDKPVRSPYHDMVTTAANGFDLEKKRLAKEWGVD